MNVPIKGSLKEDLDTIYKGMPGQLLDDEGYKRLAAVTKQLPAGLSNFWGLECRLNTGEPLADVLFEIKNNSLGQKLLAGRIVSGVDALCAKYSAWHKLRTFARQWTQETNIVNKHIHNLWLEYDTEQLTSHTLAADLVGTPSVFLGLRSKELSRIECAQTLNDAAQLLQVPPHLLANMLIFIDNLPPGGQLFQLGSMLGRPSRDLRVCVNHLKADFIPGWLADNGWKGDSKSLAAFLQQLTPHMQALAVDLNLTDNGPAEKIGIECYMDWHNKDAGQWMVLLDLIGEYVTCTPGKCKGLLQYPGAVPLSAEHRKPADGTLYLSVFKMIHHIKLGWNGSCPTDAKAYLAVYRPGIDFNSNWLIQ